MEVRRKVFIVFILKNCNIGFRNMYEDKLKSLRIPKFRFVNFVYRL